MDDLADGSSSIRSMELSDADVFKALSSLDISKAKATPNRFHVHGSGGSDFCSSQKKKKKKVGALLCMRTSTNLRRRDTALLEEDIHGDFNDIHAFFFFAFFFFPYCW